MFKVESPGAPIPVDNPTGRLPLTKQQLAAKKQSATQKEL
jgi:hypothetical protein